MTQNQQQHQIAYIAQGIRQLAAAAACAQAEMHAFKCGKRTPSDVPLVMLDTLAERLAQPYLSALIKLGHRPQHEEQKTQ